MFSKKGNKIRLLIINSKYAPFLNPRSLMKIINSFKLNIDPIIILDLFLLRIWIQLSNLVKSQFSQLNLVKYKLLISSTLILGDYD